MADLAKLVVRLEAQSAQLLTELDKANRKIDRFAAQTSKTLNKWAAGLLAAFSARALIQFGNDAIKAADSLNDMSKKAGVSVETLSALGYAAEQSGTDLAGLETGLAKLSKTAVAAAEGSKAATDAFKAIGVSATNADGSLKATDQLLLEIADSFSKHADGIAKSALAQQIFGKSGAALIPFLNEGAEGIKKLTDEADRLGITISGKTAQAADDFNDGLSKLHAILRGQLSAALTDFLVVANGLVDSFTNSAAGADQLRIASDALVFGLKLIADIGSRVWETFTDVGRALGALAAAAVAVATGKFQEAHDIIADANREGAEREAFYTKFRVDLWKNAGDEILQEVTVTAKKIQEQFSFGGAGSGLGEIKIKIAKIELGPLEQFYADLDNLTATAQEKALRAVYEQQAALEELAATQRITAEQYAARLEEINKARNDALGITKLEEEAETRRQKVLADGEAVWQSTRTAAEQYEQTLVKLNLLLQQGAIDQETYGRAVEQAQEELDKASGKMTDFAEQMRRNVQDILGQGLVDIVKGSTGDILTTFTDMITQLVAQAIAADLAGKLFGTDGGKGGSGTGGWIGAGIDFLSGFFGGSRDSGGRGKKGMAYAIGSGAQPEVFVPDAPGTFYPRGEGMGGGGVRQNIYVQGRVDTRTARQLEIQAARQQRIATARLG